MVGGSKHVATSDTACEEFFSELDSVLSVTGMVVCAIGFLSVALSLPLLPLELIEG